MDPTAGHDRFAAFAFFCRRGRRWRSFLGSFAIFWAFGAGALAGAASPLTPARWAILPAAEPTTFAAVTKPECSAVSGPVSEWSCFFEEDFIAANIARHAPM